MILLDEFRLVLLSDQGASQGMLTQALSERKKGGNKVVKGNPSTGPKGNSGKKPTTPKGGLYYYI